MAKQIDLEEDHAYASKWELTDFYDGVGDVLRNAIESGEDFDTGDFGCKEEIRYARVHRERGEFEVEVTAHMDDLWDDGDLIYDALWTVAKSGDELPEDIIDSIRDAAIDSGVDDHTYCNRYLPLDATYETVVETISELEDEAEQTNEELYRILCEIVKDHVEFMKEQKAKGEQK